MCACFQTLEKAEKRLEAEIAAAKANACPENPSPVNETTAIGETRPIRVEENKPTRVVFGVLSKEEITRRSEPGYSPKNACKSTGPKTSTSPKKPIAAPLRYRDLPPSPHRRHHSPRVKRPQSPLVTSENNKDKIVRICTKSVPKDLDTTVDIITVSAMDKSKLETSLNSSNLSPKMSPSLGKSPKGLSPRNMNSLEYRVSKYMESDIKIVLELSVNHI